MRELKWSNPACVKPLSPPRESTLTCHNELDPPLAVLLMHRCSQETGVEAGVGARHVGQVDGVLVAREQLHGPHRWLGAGAVPRGVLGEVSDQEAPEAAQLWVLCLSHLKVDTAGQRAGSKNVDLV